MLICFSLGDKLSDPAGRAVRHEQKRTILGYGATLTAAELEMMNLTGDGNGIDMVLMPAEWRNRVPTANFFQPGGYERNPVVIRNNVVAKLLAATNAKMDE